MTLLPTRASWAALAIVALLCAILGWLQYRWIGEVSRAERDRLHEDVRFALADLSRALGPADLDSSQLRELTTRYLTAPGLADYEIEIVTTGPNPVVIYSSNPAEKTVWKEFDATEPIFDGPPGFGRGPGFWPPRSLHRGPPPGPPGRKRLLARHKSGSLESLVAAAQRRNLAVSGAILLLILGIATALVTLTRRAHALAEAQIGFVAGVSHELRTPLTVIRTAAFNLGKPEFRERAGRYAELITSESRKLEALIDQVLHFAAGRAGHAVRELRPTALGPLIEEAVREMPSGEFDVKVQADLPLVPADERAVCHAIRNLLDNAVRYGGGKAVSVNVRSVTLNRFPHVEIEVADHGEGIPQEEIGRIFDPFFRGSRALRDQIHGTGLGLNIVKTIAEAHGGEITIRSQSGQGATFLFLLPCPPNRTGDESGDMSDNS